MSFLLFDYTGSAMKDAVYSFRSRLVVSKNHIFCLKKRNLPGPPILTVFYISLRFCTRVRLINAYKVFL